MGLAWSVGANAADLQWSANGVTPGGGGTGTWNTSAPALWFNGATFQTWNNAALDNAVFGGTAGTVTLGVAITAHNLTFNTSGYTVTGNTLTLGGVSPTIGVVSAGSAAIGSVIAGTAGLTNAGLGTLTLSGANNYTGGTTINAGTLSINSDARLGNTSGGITFGGGTLQSTASFTSNRGVTVGAGGGTFNTSSGTLTLGGVITGTGPLTKIGAGTLTLTGNSTYAGGTTINAGTFVVSTDANLGAASGGLTFGGGTLQSTATFTSNRNVTLTGGGTFNTNAATTLTLGGAITGTGSLSKSGTGTLTLTGANTYTGTTTISAGTLALSGSGSIASSSQVNVSNAAGTFDISGTSLGATITTLAGVTNSHVTLGGQTLTISNGSTTYAGIIQGTGGLTVSGGTQILSGANTYTGATNVNAGTLQAGATNTFAPTSAFTVASGATLVLSNFNQIIGSLAGAGTVTNGSTNNRTLTTGGDNTSTAFSGVIQNGGASATNLTKAGTGTFTLTGANTYTGTTTISAGTLALSGSGSIASSSQVNVSNAAGTFDISGTSSGATITTLNGVANSHVTLGGQTLTISNGSTTYAGIIQGTGGLTVTGGTQTLSGANTYTGTTTINGGTLAVSSDANLGAASGGLTFGGGTLQSTATFTSNRNVTLTGGGTFNTNAATTLTLGGAITGTGSLTKSGTGTLTLTGASTYSGATAVNTGTLQAGATNAFSSASAHTVTSALDLSGFNQTIGSLAGAGTVTNAGGAAATLTTGGNNTSTTFSGVIQDGAGVTGLTKVGTGTFTLTGANTYMGITTISAGTLQIGNGGATGSIVGDIVDNAALVFNRSNAATYAGVISGTGSVTKIGAGTRTLTGTNTYSGGTTINVGTLAVSSDANLGAASGGLTFGGGTLQSTAAFTSNRGVTLNAGGGTFNTNAATTLTLGGTISGAGGLSKSGAGTLTLTGTNTYGGATTISGGILAVSSDANLGAATGILNVRGGGTLQFLANFTSNRNVTIGPGNAIFDTNGHDGTLGGAISVGSGSTELHKIGAGTLTLTGNNTYTGQLQINAGTLILTGDNQPSITSTPISSGATLQIGNGGGTGSLTGNVTDDGLFIINRSNAYTFGGVISGTGSFVQMGAGTTTLTATNTYSGGTTINAGTLAVSTDANLGNTSGGLSFGGGTLQYLAGFTSNRGVTLNAGGGTFDTNGNDATLSGTIGGIGGLAKIGAGTLTLTGTSTYLGATAVNAGTLMVNGSLGNTAVSVNAGATLGGSGTIAGGVTVANGGSVSPGSSPGTLTVGSLALSSGSFLNYELGLPNLFNNAGSDRIDVTGNLILNGTLNISNSGGMGPGVYRLFNYGGALTDNALAIGTVPPGFSPAAMSVQTAIATQVNLIVEGAGGPLQFWNGAQVTPNNTINGGTGTWDAATTNWTNQNGSATAPWGSGFAVFTGAAGTVTVAGAQAFTGLQFITDGYQLVAGTGGELTPVGTAFLRVDPGVTAEIAAPITGTGGINKADAGTLVLSGSNSYSGGTTLSGGILQVSSDGNLGAAAGGLTFDGGALRVTGTSFQSTARGITWGPAGGGFDIADAANVFTVGQALSGPGGLLKAGAGTLVLTGANGYTGGTMITAGMLQLGNGGTSGSILGDVRNNGTFAINRSDAYTFGGLISGTGSLTQAGTGATILIGANTYTGGTTISAGMLQLGNGGTSGSILGDVLNNGTFAINRSDIYTFGGVISGTGSFVQMGPGTAVLTGNNTYSGGTTVDAGTLQLGPGGNLAPTGALTVNAGGTFDLNGFNQMVGDLFGSGLITLGSGTLAAGTANSTIFGGAISGTGGFVKQGTGTLMFTGASTYTGATSINAGALVVNGSIADSAVTVNSGGTLAGIGTVGATTINNGGTFAPGNSPGTMTVQGNLAFQSGALYLVQVNPSTASSANAVIGGTATLAGTVQAVFASGSYASRTYTIITAAGGLAGTTFNTLTTTNLPAGFTPSLSYTANNVILNLTAALGTGGLSGNQQNVAGALNNFFNNGGTLPANFVNVFGLTGANLGNALSQLSGEAATGGQQAGFQMTNQFLGLMLDPFVDGRSGVAGAGGPAIGFAPEREPLPEEIALAYTSVLKAPVMRAPTFEQRWAAWGGAYGGSNRTSGDPAVVGSHDLSARATGFAGGLDYHLSRDSVVGFALAGGGTNWSLAQGLGGGKSDAFQAGVYGATRSGPAYLAAAIAYTNHWMSTDRFAFAGDHLSASFNAQSLGARVESGYRFATVYGGFTPYAAVQAQNFRTPSYSETDLNGGGFALAYNSRTGTDTRSELGGRFDRVLALYTNAVLSLRARLAWAHDWVSDPTLAAAFQMLPGASFIVNGATPAKDSALVSAGTELRITNGVSLLGKFDGEFARGSSTYAGTGTVRYAW